MNEISKVLNHDEKVLWEGEPKFWPYFLTGVTPSFIFGLIWMGFLTPFIIAFNFLHKVDSGKATGFVTTFFRGLEPFFNSLYTRGIVYVDRSTHIQVVII